MGSTDRPLWPTIEPERPWSLPALFWNFATPWAWARIYGHVGEAVLFRLWFWSRGPLWWIEDQRTGLDWKIQAAVKRAHEDRMRRSGREP